MKKEKRYYSRQGMVMMISEWNSKRTNPTSEKIMVICNVLKVTPEWLLSGIEKTGVKGNTLDWYVIGKDTEMGEIIKSIIQ